MYELPSIAQYVDSLSSPSDMTRTLGDFQVETNTYGEIKFRAGNNAAVFKIQKDDKCRMLKCYIKSNPNIPAIYDYLSKHHDGLCQPAEYLPQEIYVFGNFSDGSYFDVVMADWINGNSLEVEIRHAGQEHGRNGFEKLSDAFDKLALELLGKEWAHGDLKPENIIVKEDGSMVLIDYDAMYVPGVKTTHAFEIGTPGYQHPHRDEKLYDKHIDDYPIALISSSLRALACEPDLYNKYNRSDIIITHPEDILKGCSEGYEEMLTVLAREGFHNHYALARKLNSTSPEIEGLDRIIKRIVHPQPNVITDTPLLFEHNGSWGYRAPSGDIVLEPIYDECTDFRDGTAVVQLRGISHIISEDGCIVVNGKDLDGIKPFSEGRAAIRKDGKWGLINRNGSTVCEFMFDDTGSIHEGRIKIQLSGLWGYADSNGDLIIEPRYNFATSFKNGTAIVEKDGNTLQIDTHGNIIC